MEFLKIEEKNLGHNSLWSQIINQVKMQNKEFYDLQYLKKITYHPFQGSY